MAKISKALAEKLYRLVQGELIPASQLKNGLIFQMIEDGVLEQKLKGRSQKTVYSTSPNALQNYLSNEFGINNIQAYIENEEQGASRAENIITSSDSKNSKIRTFKGFLVNCISPIETTLKGVQFIIQPREGAFTYIYDFDDFSLPKDVLVIGVENAENFRQISKQADLFDADKVLFVSRYPQSNDLINWLKEQQNNYLHYGDFDFEGIRIFRDEYQKHLNERASFFIPPNIEELIEKYGNKALYDKQYNTKLSKRLQLSPEIDKLIHLFHKYKKCLEQEVLIVKRF